MDNKHGFCWVCGLVVVAAVVIGLSFLPPGWLAGQFGFARGEADRPAPWADPQANMVTGKNRAPGKWQPYTFPGAHYRRHRMYNHPAACSPNLNAPHQLAYDWMFTPPAEGDL